MSGNGPSNNPTLYKWRAVCTTIWYKTGWVAFLHSHCHMVVINQIVCWWIKKYLKSRCIFMDDLVLINVLGKGENESKRPMWKKSISMMSPTLHISSNICPDWTHDNICVLFPNPETVNLTSAEMKTHQLCHVTTTFRFTWGVHVYWC